MAVLVVAASAAAMLLTATPASAATFDVRTAFNPGSPHNGQAWVEGRIAWIGPRGADISAWTTDVCPADGYGAYARLRVVDTRGYLGYTGWIWFENQGCGNASYSPPDLFVWDTPIRYIQVHVCERDRNGGQWRFGDCKFSNQKDNPYT